MVRNLNNLDYDASYEEIAYLDENIIIFRNYLFEILDSHTHSINTGKEIEIKDFISNLNDRNLLALLRQKVDDYFDEHNVAEFYYSFGNNNYFNYNFLITPKDIIFYTYGTETYNIYLNFTFEELKPFIKKGSPLDYLFN